MVIAGKIGAQLKACVYNYQRVLGKFPRFFALSTGHALGREPSQIALMIHRTRCRLWGDRWSQGCIHVRKCVVQWPVKFVFPSGNADKYH